MATTPTTLPALIEAYRAAEYAGDSHTMNVTSDAIRGQNDRIMWALINESAARRRIARLTELGQCTREYEHILANALEIIAEELDS